MASFRGIRIEDNVIERDDSVMEEVWFDESILREVTEIGNWCFGLQEDKVLERASELSIDSFRLHHSSEGPSVLDLSLLKKCERIGDGFAAGHYGPVFLPPALQSAGDQFMLGLKCRALELPASLESVEEGSFAYATADRIIFRHGMTDFELGCFKGARIATLEIPGSVKEIGHDFCSGATIGTLTFAESNAGEHVSLSVRSFLENATVQTLDLRRSVRLVVSDESSDIDASATISVLRHLLPTQLSDPTAALLTNLPDALHEKATSTDPEVSRAAPQPPLAADSDVDLAALEVFEDKHRSLVQDGDIIDMRGLDKCLTLGPKCFAGLTDVSKLLLPPHLTKISEGFMEDANVPELDIVFPKSLQDVEDGVLRKATARSVDFAACDGLTVIGCCLIEATIKSSIVFPQTLSDLGSDFLKRTNSPQLDLVFPSSLEQIPDLAEVTVRSINCSACEKVHKIGRGCLERSTFESFVFPPNVTTIEGKFMAGAQAPKADLDFPSSVSTVRDDVLSEATVGSVNFSNCGALHSISKECLRSATVASVLLPPKLRVLKPFAFKGVRGEDLAITFPESLQDIEHDVLADSSVKSIDMSAAESVTHIPPSFCRRATVSDTATLPPAVTSLGHGAFSDFTCAQFQFDASPSLELIESGVFRGANISTVTITDSPKLKSVGDNFLSKATLETPASLVFTDRMTSVGKSFCAGTTLQRLHMDRCDKVTTLPNDFLFEADFSVTEAEGTSETCVCLPPKVSTYGDQCFASSKGITSIPERKSALTVGNAFGADSDIEKIPWVGYWVTVGHSFCKGVKAIEIADAACFYSVGNDFCRDVGELTVDFSRFAVKELGTGFLQEATFSPKTTSVDLSRCSFAECPRDFMYKARFEGGGKVALPSTVSLIQAQCCAEAVLEDLSIASSDTSAPLPLTIEDDFLHGCASLKTVVLPATVTSFGDGCFQECELREVVSLSLSLPLVKRIGNHFCDYTNSASAMTPRMKVSLENVCPHVQIGDNFLAHADCTALEFGTIDCVAVKKDTFVVDLQAALRTARSAADTSDGTTVLKQLIALRKMTVMKLASATANFRSITDELSVIEARKDLPDRTERIDALLKELRLEEDLFFRHNPMHQYKWAREALKHRDYDNLLKVQKEMNRLVDEERHRDLTSEDQQATSPQPSVLAIGDNFLAGTTGLKKLDMSGAAHTAIGNRFAANSEVEEVHLPPSATKIGKELCDGCRATVTAAPQCQSTSECYLASWMKIHSEKERIDRLVRFRELLPTTEQCGMARWLLEQKRFAELKATFELGGDAADLRYVGGTVDDLPEIPDDVPAWFGFDVKVSPDDAGLSLLHWAVKYSRQFSHLLSEVSWSLRDLTLMTEQGFTALHYAVLYDIEAAALGTLLSIAAKAEIHRTWNDAWAAGGVRVSPLHLAYLYRRDSIVKELLAFEWDPTETIKPVNGNDALTLFDAFDQSVMELGHARAAVALQDTDDNEISENSRVPVPVQLFHTSILLCVCDALEAGIHRGDTTDHGIQRAFLVLRHRLPVDFPLLSPNKSAEARAQQLALAAWGSRDPNADDKLVFDTQEEFLHEAFAAALSDSVHGPNVRLQHRQLLSTTTSLKEFVLSRVGNLPDVPTHEFVAEASTCVQAKFHRICQSKPSQAALKITAETLLLRTRSMEEGPHRGKVEDKLAVVIPFRFVIPVLPFFYLMLMVVFGLSWFFHPPILEPTLMGIENAIAGCTNPYNTKDATEDGVIPWNCSVGFTELGMQVETFGKQATGKQTEAAPQMASFFSFIEKDKIPRNVTHLPWAYLRFATIVTYNGLKTKADSVADAETTPAHTAQKYWVLTELRKPPEWVPEIFEQKNTKANESTISFKGETTRTFAHTVVPYQFGNQTLLGVWMAGVAALLLACIVAFVYHGYTFYKIIAEREVRLVEVTTVQRSLRSILLACELAAVLFIAVGLVIMATAFDQHKTDDLISRSTAAKWQRAEIFFRVGLTFCSFRAVSFFSEMPKPHHFAMVNAGVVGVGLIAALVSLLLFPASRVGIVASLKSLLSIQAVDALTLPVVLAVSLFLRSSKVTDEVRQAHYDNLREDLGDESGRARRTDAASRETASCNGVEDPKNNATAEHQTDVIAPAAGDQGESGRATAVRVVGAAGLDVGDSGVVGLMINATTTHQSEVAASGDQDRSGDQRPVAEEDDPAVACLSLSAGRSSRNGRECMADGNEPICTAVTFGPAPSAELPPSAPPPANEPSVPEGAVRSTSTAGSAAESSTTRAGKNEETSDVLSKARRRWVLSWAVILVAGLGQVLLYGLAVTVVVRPLLTLPAPGGVLPVTGDSFLSSDDLGMVGFARRFFF